MTPRWIGPAGMSGRVTALDAVHARPEEIWVGTASGGVWKSTGGGTGWQQVFNDVATQNVGSIAIDQNTPDVVWVGTGEGNPRNSVSSGAGIWKTLDGGKSWQFSGLENTKSIHRVIVHRDNSSTVFAAALGSPWGPNPERGVFKTTDFGTTWKKVLYVNDSTGAADLVADPSNPQKMFAAMWEHMRKPWTFSSGGKGSGLYMTLDGGESWTKLGPKNGLPEGPLGRIGVAVSRSNPKVVYAIIEAKKLGIWRSDDGGHSWRKMSEGGSVGNRPFYYAEIYVDPANENRVYSLFSLVNKSEDGGKTFETLLPYSGVHPDHHAWWIHPANPNFMIDGNDGGIAITRDRGATWRFAENIPAGQFYHIAVDTAMPYRIYGGLQDNGSWRGPSYIWRSGGIRNSDWQELLFGDGFDCVPIPTQDNRYGYALYQGGNLNLWDAATGKTQSIKPVHPRGEKLRFNWNTAIAVDPHNPDALYTGSQYVHKSTDRGANWEIISPDLTTNDTLKQKQHLSGGLTIDATAAENHTTILAISPSGIKKGVVWVGTDDGRLHCTTDDGKSWTSVESKLPGCPKNAWIPAVHASPHSAGEAFAVVNNYRQNDWKPYLYHTPDYGATWRRIADEKNVQGYCLAVVQDPVEPNLLFLGTEQGLWVSFNKGASWQQWKNGFPSVSTMDLVIHPREHDLVIGTFGRAVYVLDDIRPLRAIASTPQILKRPFAVFPPPQAVTSEWRSYDGVRFDADGMFNGENRPAGARLSLWVESLTPDTARTRTFVQQQKSLGLDTNVSWKDVRFSVVNMQGDTIRRFEVPADTGLVRRSWDLCEAGLNWPARQPKSDEYRFAQPAGAEVEPGTYRLYARYGCFEDSCTVSVIADPRLPAITAEVRRAIRERKEKGDALVRRAADVANSLAIIRRSLAETDPFASRLKDGEKNTVDSLRKTLADSVAALEAMYFESPTLNGMDHVTERVSSLLWRNYSLGMNAVPASGNAESALRHADDVISGIERRMAAILSNHYPRWKEAVEAALRIPEPK